MAKRCYVGLVAVQEQAEDILVPPLLRNCLTLMTFPFLDNYLPSRIVILAIVFYCIGHFKSVYDDDDDDSTNSPDCLPNTSERIRFLVLSFPVFHFFAVGFRTVD